MNAVADRREREAANEALACAETLGADLMAQRARHAVSGELVLDGVRAPLGKSEDLSAAAVRVRCVLRPASL